MDTGILYIVATPIGNLGDITFRAVETLKEADLIACEDTRQTVKLLNHYGIKKPLVSYFQHSKISKIDHLVGELKSGKNIALVTDAGTPGISDPGNILVEKVLESNIKVVPIPGVSALNTIASVSGMDMSRFVFLGFPPHKKGRKTFVADIIKSELPVIIYESKYRLQKLLEEFSGYGGKERMKLIIGREMTKMFEEIIRGDLKNVIDIFKNDQNKSKGEFTIIIYK